MTSKPFYAPQPVAFMSPINGRSVGVSKNIKISKSVKKETTNGCTSVEQDYDSLLEYTIVHSSIKKLFYHWKL